MIYLYTCHIFATQQVYSMYSLRDGLFCGLKYWNTEDEMLMYTSK